MLTSSLTSPIDRRRGDRRRARETRVGKSNTGIDHLDFQRECSTRLLIVDEPRREAVGLGHPDALLAPVEDEAEGPARRLHGLALRLLSVRAPVP